ncbi:MAG TPA: sulfotransferase, partial [Acidimicrobiales bacterium]
VDVDAVVADLGGVCQRPFDLFQALVRQLAGPAEMWGEKTPNHLVWWRPISEAAPWMRFVAVVRDPRAVVASNLEMPWRTDRTLPAWGDDLHLAFAELWSFFQGQVLRLSHELGPERSLVLRYEDVVKDSDATRRRLAQFLGRPADVAPQAAPSDIVLPWEAWKARALEPVAGDRVDSWHDQLDSRRAGEIALVCRTAMRRFDYAVDLPRGPAVAVRWVRLGPLRVLRLARYARARRLHLRTVEGLRL